MKKYFSMALIAFFCVCMAGNAQDRQGQRPQRGPRLEPKEQAQAMAKELGLTEEQTAQVQKLFEEQVAKRKAAQSDNSSSSTMSREDRRAQFEKEQQAFSKDLEKIIGKEKTDLWKKKMEERRQQRRQQQN